MGLMLLVSSASLPPFLIQVQMVVLVHTLHRVNITLCAFQTPASHFVATPTLLEVLRLNPILGTLQIVPEPIARINYRLKFPTSTMWIYCPRVWVNYPLSLQAQC
jgi:hypothetical protein